MRLSIAELAQAKDAAKSILEEIGLDAYIFEVEPTGNTWSMKIDCAMDDGWESLTLQVDKDLLLSALENPNAREVILKTWGEKLSACKINPSVT
jgi:hypothetical protein